MQMHILKRIEKYIQKFIYISDYIYQHGGLAIFVGGIIRSAIMQLHTYDCDIESYFLTKNNLSQILKKKFKVLFVGSSFGVFKLCGLNIDISMPRTEKCIGVKHTDFDISLNCYSGYKKSASRRDFTINSIGYIHEYNILLDPFDGVNDITQKIIRPINTKSFIEDPLRFLRAIYFAEKLNFKFSSSMEYIFLKYCNNIQYVSYQRISHEFEKIFQVDKITIAIHYLSKIQIFCFNFAKIFLNCGYYNEILNYLNMTKNLHVRIVIIYYYLSIYGCDYNSINILIKYGTLLKVKYIKSYWKVTKIIHIIQQKLNKNLTFQKIFNFIIYNVDINTIKYIQEYTIEIFNIFNNTQLIQKDLEQIFILFYNFKILTYFNNTKFINKIKSITIEQYYLYYYIALEKQSNNFKLINKNNNYILKITLIESCLISLLITTDNNFDILI